MKNEFKQIPNLEKHVQIPNMTRKNHETHEQAQLFFYQTLQFTGW